MIPNELLVPFYFHARTMLILNITILVTQFCFTPRDEWCRLGDRFKAFGPYFDLRYSLLNPEHPARAVGFLDGFFALTSGKMNTQRAQVEDSERKANDEALVTASSKAS